MTIAYSNVKHAPFLFGQAALADQLGQAPPLLPLLPHSWASSFFAPSFRPLNSAPHWLAKQAQRGSLDCLDCLDWLDRLDRLDRLDWLDWLDCDTVQWAAVIMAGAHRATV